MIERNYKYNRYNTAIYVIFKRCTLKTKMLYLWNLIWRLVVTAPTQIKIKFDKDNLSTYFVESKQILVS